MAITAALVKELRERTGAGMMECKKMLQQTDGDIEAAIEEMRKSGQAKAAKKAGRIAAEGLIVISTADDGKSAAMAEVNCETDFVAKDENFSSFAADVADRVRNSEADDVEALIQLPLRDGEETTIEQAREALVAKIGENMSVRRFVRMRSSGGIYSYRHGVRIGVLVDMEGGDEELGRDIAMHIAASNPLCVAESDVPADVLEKEREIYRDEARQSGKPENILDKIIEGKVRKYLEGVTLLGQAFVKDPDTTVGKLLEKSGARVVAFRRFEVGEGIEKKQEDFAAEVMAQVKGS
ncbi:MAG: translation elongation factor Ts [Gammaproteobacteria bacterium]|jgi:elongation factor Ts